MRKTPADKAGILAIKRTYLTQEEMVLAQTGLCCLLLPRNMQDTQVSSDVFLKVSVWQK